MTRLVRHDQTGPKIVDEEDIDSNYGNIAICQCGLSDDYPFCDGSHKATRDEEEGELYRYENDDADGSRHRVDNIEYVD